MSAELKAGKAFGVGRIDLARTWPYGGGHELDSHPGIFPLPGSISLLAGHDVPFAPASAGEAHPSLSSTLPESPVRGIHTDFLPGVSDRETPRCFERGLLLNGGCVFRATRISFASESPVLGGLNDCARDSADVLPRVGLHAHSMESPNGEVVAFNYVK